MAEAEAQPKPSKMKWIVGGCCGCTAVAALAFFGIFGLGALGVMGIIKETEPAAVETRAFLEKTTAGDVPGAYAYLHTKFKETLPQEGLKKMVDERPELFQVKETTFNNRALNGNMVKLAGTLVNTKGDTEQCRFKLVEEGGAWKLIAFQISPQPIPDSD